MQLELANNFNGDGKEFSAQRSRVGLGINNFQFGLAGDINQSGPKAETPYNAGILMRKEF